MEKNNRSIKKNTVSIVVLNYNGLSFLKKCITSINRQTYSFIEIIVVDNNSTDGSEIFLKDMKKIKLIKNAQNFGYAKANNIGAKNANGTYLFFLNNDTQLLPTTVEQLVKSWRNKSILAPKQIITNQKEVEKTGRAGNGIDIFGYPYGKVDGTKTKIFYADGAALFVKKEDFKIIGMFDKKLFLFQEDIDFSWRAQMMGFSIIPCWEAKLYHFGGGAILGKISKNNVYQTSYLRRYLNERNVIRNILKNYSFPFCFILLIVLFFIHVCEIVVLFLFRGKKATFCYVNAYIWNIKHFKNTLRYRKEIQNKRTMSDFALMKKMYFSYSKLITFLRLGFPEFI